VYDDYTVLITLGALLEYLRQSFALHGAGIEFSFDFSDFDPLLDKAGMCHLSLSDKPTHAFKIVSRQALLGRATDRRPYQPAHSLSLDENDINSRLSFSSCAVHIDADDKTLDFFAQCDSLAWGSKAIGLDIMSYISFADPPAERGLP